MQFRKSAISAAIGLGFATLAGQALALDASQFDANTFEVFISGASAQDEGVKAAIARICADGTLDLYQFDSNNRAFFCSVIPSLYPGLTGGANKVVFYKSSVGGSGNGVTPLLGTGSNINFMSMAQIKSAGICTSVTTVVASLTTAVDPRGVPSYNLRNCPTAAINIPHKPSGGLSDVEPRLFTDTDVSGLVDQSSSNALIFGMAVNEKLYRALQAMQGLDSSNTNPDTTNAADTTINQIATLQVRDNEANMPSLSKETITAILAGNLQQWSLLRGPAGQTLAPNSAADDQIYVARRVPSSGSQHSTEIFFLGGSNPTDGSHLTKCNPSTPPMVSSNGTGAADSASVACPTSGTPPQPVFQGSGTGDVRNCLANHDTNNRYAIGLLSTETPFTSPDNASEEGKKLRFIKIDGSAPSMINVATGRYKFWVEQSGQKAAYYSTLPTNEKIGIDAFFNELRGAAAITAALNTTFNHRWGQGTLLSLVLGGATPTDPTPSGLTQVKMIANPVNPFSKGVAGFTDNCTNAQFVGAVSGTGAQENP
jgi:hypothetical protein